MKTLNSRYVESSVFFSGIHAVVRGLLDQARQDQKDGLKTSGFISGYQGSPLAVLDGELTRQKKLLKANSIVFQPGLNEELGATSVWGSQMAPYIKDTTQQGVFGLWYGKAPGLDRALDPLRHANFSGCGEFSGAICLVGDDPGAKSSTVPSRSEDTLKAIRMPIFMPRTVLETSSIIQAAYELSRLSGLWSSVILPTAVADGTASGQMTEWKPMKDIEGVKHIPHSEMLAQKSILLEQSLYETRLPKAFEYAEKSVLNQTFGSDKPELSIFASGVHAVYLEQVLKDAGMFDKLEELGIRIISLGLPWPLSTEWMEKRVAPNSWVLSDKPFSLLENLVKETSTKLVPVSQNGGELLPETVSQFLQTVLQTIGMKTPESLKSQNLFYKQKSQSKQSAQQTRMPSFCSGCPHNTTLQVENQEQLVGAGIGCHTMVLLHQKDRGEITGITQMGGEGAQWIGMSPFVERDHFVQNLGDGTYQHSGSLAIRASVAAKQNVTYRIMLNGAVAMTGGQKIVGGLQTKKIIKELLAEEVEKITVISENPKQYKKIKHDKVAFMHRDLQEQALADLSTIKGTTILIYDGACRAEQRRWRKRGSEPQQEKRIFINQRVCEGCGDCGDVSSCLSVEPVETELGRKTQINQESCNGDYSCTKGNCPSFMEITDYKSNPVALPPLPDLPQPQIQENANIRIVGIGGTGTVTIAQILSMAAHLDDKKTFGLDQTGLSQKGGTVISDVAIGTHKSRFEPGTLDILIAADALGGVSHLHYLKEDAFVLVNQSVAPTIENVVDKDTPVENVNSFYPKNAQFYPVTEICSQYFADSMPANCFLLGIAAQQGKLPVSIDSLQEALRQNKAAVQTNLQAFEFGRAIVVNPGIANLAQETIQPYPISKKAKDKISELVTKYPDIHGQLEKSLKLRVGELTLYQNQKYALKYLHTLWQISQKDPTGKVVYATSQSLYHLMAFKDEYEIARLWRDEREKARRANHISGRGKILLLPPLFKKFKLNKKIAIPQSFAMMLFLMLCHMKFLRATPFDIFRSSHRKKEWQLWKQFSGEMLEFSEQEYTLHEQQMVLFAELPLKIRGYEEIKEQRIKEYQIQKASLLDRIKNQKPSKHTLIQLPLAN